MSDPSNIPWNRIFVEGLAIIASILIAFAIDAWWQDRQETELEIRNLDRVSAELKANSERIQRKLQTIDDSIVATSNFISWMGPQPTILEKEVLIEQWDTLYGIGFFSLQWSATRDYLASGQTDSAKSVKVRRAISEWYSSGTDLEEQYERLRVAHADIFTYLQDEMPVLYLIRSSSLMNDHPESRFPFDPTKVLADPKLESRLALFLIRLEFASDQAARLNELQRELITLIDAAIQEAD